MLYTNSKLILYILLYTTIWCHWFLTFSVNFETKFSSRLVLYQNVKCEYLKH